MEYEVSVTLFHGENMSPTSLIPSTDRIATTRPNDRDVEFVAMLDEDDFEAARDLIPDLAMHGDYEDWLDDRYGLVVGLCSSGVDAKSVKVELSHFLAWCRYANLAPTEESLDDFATIVAIMRDHFHADVDLKTIATVSQAEFSAYFGVLEAFQGVGDYSGWVARREATVQAALATGAVVCRAPAPIAEFLEWARCLGAGSTEALLDRYATLALETYACP